MRSARLRLAGAALLPFLLLAATACEFGSDDKDKGAKDAKADNAAASNTPSGAASSAGAPGAAPAASGSPAPAGAAPGKALTGEQLKAALATQKELGAGWTVRPITGTVYGSSPMKAVAEDAVCQPLLDLMTGATPKSAAYAGELLTTTADQGTTTGLDLVRFEGDALTKTFDAAVKAAAAHDCLEVTATNTKNEKTVYDFQYVDKQPKFGDGSMWLAVTWGDEKTMADPNEPTTTARLQFVRIGSTLVKYDARPDNTSFGAEFVPEASVKIQVDKLTAALKS